MMMTVTLTIHEAVMAGVIGIKRRLSAIYRNSSQANTMIPPDRLWESDIEGAIAELAVCKALKIYWHGSINTFKGADAGTLQVRWTKYPDGHLVVRNGDSGADIFVLVTGRVPDFSVIGWIRGTDAKNDKYRKDPNNLGKPAWFVPQSDLRTIAELP